MRRGTAVRKSLVSFVQIQEEYTREEYGELRNLLGTTRITWDKVNKILFLGEENKFKARPGDFIVIPDVLGEAHFEVIQKGLFDFNFINIADSPAVDREETGEEREKRQFENRAADVGTRQKGSTGEEQDIFVRTDREGNEFDLAGREIGRDKLDPRVVRDQNQTHPIDSNATDTVGNVETDEQKREREHKAFGEQNRPIVDVSRLDKQADSTVFQNTGSSVPAKPLTGETNEQNRAREEKERLDASLRAKGLTK